MIHVIGIGSPFGDDRAGLAAARRLAASPPPGSRVVCADRPGVDLVPLLDGAAAAIVIDAVRSGAPAGTVHDLDLHAVPQAGLSLVSSHDLGVAEAIALAAALGRLPAHGRLLGVEIPPGAGAPEGELSGPVERAVAEVVRRVRSWVERWESPAPPPAAAVPSPPPSPASTAGEGAGAGRVRWRLAVSGVVQGIGFRPFVWRLASELGLGGFVRNTSDGVEIEVEGRLHRLAEFHRRLEVDAPPGADVGRIERVAVACRDEQAFAVVASANGGGHTLIPPDLATCPACLDEILDPAARRYRYPFTNCTHCGPRFTVVESLPYDRPATTLRGFPLCADCAREYGAAADRRFRAEPIACPRCGPRAWLERTGGAHAPSGDPIAAAARLLQTGALIAVQGIGGFHLACDAADAAAVARLRAVKQRPRKPLAVMVASLDDAARLAVLGAAERTLLASATAPIVLAPRRAGARLAAAVAPGADLVGVMLPYAPLHHLLLRDAGRPLVMTSANRPGEPLARTAAELRAAFDGCLDAVLLHDRPIHQRCDDGVWMVTPRGPQPVRRSRGSVPERIAVPIAAPTPVLGIGGDLKNAFCLLDGRTAVPSQYVGAMEHAATQAHFLDSLDKLVRLTGVAPAAVAHDLHPGYATRAVAERLALPMIGVQHHHAHIAACLADNGCTGPVIGIAFDGTGYGADGAIWGGEVLVADIERYRRVGHLEYLPLPGGDAAIRHPARIAAAYLLALFGEVRDTRLRAALGAESLRVLARMIERGVNTVPTSSCGRLFDAVAALLGVCDEATYEGQAAIELEAVARERGPEGIAAYPFTLDDGVVHLRPLFAAILADRERGVPVPLIARRFHSTVAAIVRAQARAAREHIGLCAVALSGGCFQNRLLLADCLAGLAEDGFDVLVHRQVPANDGGLALGQAVVAAAQLAREGRPCA